MMKAKILFILISIICAIPSYGQQVYDVDLSSDSLVYELEKQLGRRDTLVGEDFIITWQQIGSDHQSKIKDHLKSLYDKKMSFRPVVANYLHALNLGVQQEGLDTKKLTDLLVMSGKVFDTHNAKQINSYLSHLIVFFKNRALHAERSHRWYVLNDSYYFEYKENFVAEVTPDDSYEEPINESETWDEEEWDDDDNWDDDDWEEEDDSWDDDDWEDEDEEDTWEDWDSDVSGSTTEDEQMLYAMGAVKAIAEVTGPAIVFETMDINLVTPYDSCFIKNTKGSYDLLNDRFVGKEGSFTWEPAGMPDVFVTLNNYEVNPIKNYFSGEETKLTFPGKFEGEIEGLFEFKSTRRDTASENSYPRFTSYYNNIELQFFPEEIDYLGGFTLKGQKITSASVMGGTNRVILKNEGNIKAKSFADHFILEDSAIYSDLGSITVYHGYDSIYHPAVRVRYKTSNDQLIIQQAKNGFRNTPYTSTFFALGFQADMIRWDLNQDSLDISILQGRKIVPAIFESEDHYHEEDYFTLGDKVYDFNPLTMVVYYSRQNKINSYYLIDLAEFYKKDEKILHGAMVMLMQKGLIDYDLKTRKITLNQKAKHLYRAKNDLTDFDNIIIESVIDTLPNASVNFEEQYMRIRGVERFLVSDSLYVEIEPDSSEITMYENRNFSFNGKVTAGNFEYIGHDFEFVYDSFLLNLKTIDSVRFFIQEENARGQKNRHRINNALVGLDSTTAKSAGLLGSADRTSGTLYINTPRNKSGRRKIPNYPKFAAGEGAVVYFDRNNVLNGAYRREMYFVVPPFDIDSLNDSDPAAIGFDGIFVSKGVLPNIEERLHYKGNDAMGFEHDIPEEGYDLFEGRAKIFGHLDLSHRGLRNNGRVKYLATVFDSDDIIVYPDSITAVGQSAEILEEEHGGIIFPQATLDSFSVKWIPGQDQMIYANRGKPFSFYHGIASLEGETMVVSTGGVYGRGTLRMKGSIARSQQMKFERDRFLARHADFEVETNDPEKPALYGDDVRLNFNLAENYAEISPEIEGRAAIEFPYAQFKTSITKARWNLNDGTITMTKPDDVPLESSYFYTTREDLDSLHFNATEAVYNIENQELKVSGIPYIKVADALITPENNEVLILENSKIGQLTNTTILLDTLNQYHRLTDGVINVISRNEFTGYATYQFVNASQDTFAIKMENFHLEQLKDPDDRRKSEGSLHTVANGSVIAEDDIIISPGILYKGDMILYAHKPAMELDGFVKLNFQNTPGYDTWIRYSSNAEQQEIMIPFSEATTEDGRFIDAGILYNAFDNNLYSIFVNEKLGLDDEYFFKPDGILRYKPGLESYVIEDTAKVSGRKLQGKYFAYNENTGDIQFEGTVKFIENHKDASIRASVIGSGNSKEVEYNMNSLLTFDFNIPSMAYDIMAADIVDVVTNLGAPEGRGDFNQLLYKLANLLGERAAREFEKGSLEGFVPLNSFTGDISKPLVFTDVDLTWSAEYRGFYNDGPLGLSHINRNEINSDLEGFIEVKKNESGGPVVNIFVKASAASWYYFGLEENRLLIHSSNEEFNNLITSKSNAAKAKIDELAFVPATNAEVLEFINRFRFEYYGINDPYVLESSSEVVEEIQKADEEEEEDDDGFDDGF